MHLKITDIFYGQHNNMLIHFFLLFLLGSLSFG